MDKKEKTYEMKERILEICKDKNISANKLSSESGMSREYIRQMKDFVSAEFMRYIIRTYPEYNIEWIIAGIGPKYKHEDQPEISLLIKMLNEEREKVKELEKKINEQ